MTEHTSIHTSMLHPSPELRAKLSKVPEVTLYFWIIKVLCTTVGETFADYLNGKLGDNLTRTTLVMGSILIASLIVTVVLLGFVTTAPAAEYWPRAGLYVLRNALLYPATYELPGVFQNVPVPNVVNGVLWTLRLSSRSTWC